MPPIPVNPDLPISYAIPGIYGYISLLGTGPTPQNKRVMILGYQTSSGRADLAGVPVRLNNEDDAVNFTGKGSDVHRIYRAFQSQQGLGAEVWCCALTAPSGTAQTMTLTVTGTPTNATTLSVNTTAQAAGIWSLWIEGYRCDVIVANGDTYATVASNMLTQIQKVQDFLSVTATVSMATITLTARHAALSSADLPVISTFSNTSMSLSCTVGMLTVASAATGAGSAIVGCATQSATATINNMDTANTIAGSINTAINSAVAFPLTACTPTGAVVNLFTVNDRVINWLSAQITATITTTLTPAWGNAAAGLPSSSTPSLSQALSNIAGVSDNSGPFRVWLTSFGGMGAVITNASFSQSGSVTDYSVLGTISSHIESQAGGRICKGQVVILCDTRALSTCGAGPVGTTPLLTASPRYFYGYAPASPQQGYELSARVGARVIGEDFLPRNYAGTTLTTDSKVPLLLPHSAVAMPDSDANSAMLTFFMYPLRANRDGYYAIVSGRTTAKPGSSIDVRFVFWGTILTVDYFRDDLRSYLGGLFKGKSIKAYSQPVTTNCVAPDGVRDVAYGRALQWDGLDFFDGAARLKDYFAAGINAFVPSRIDLSVPLAEPIPLEQISAYFQQVA